MTDEYTTGSLTPSTIRGLSSELSEPKVLKVLGNPSGLIIAVQSSGLAIDRINGSIFMSVDRGSNDWIALGSCAF